MGNIDGVIIKKLKIIKLESGDVLHGINKNEDSFAGFGEAYFSTINYNSIKGWKKHTKMVLNLVVPIGCVKFVLYDSRVLSKTFNNFYDIEISKSNYFRLTVPVGVWLAFKGTGKDLNMLLNVSSIPHDPLEADSLPLINDVIPFYDFNK